MPTIDNRATLVRLLAATGVSQSEAGRLTGNDPRAIQRWVAGSRPTPDDLILALRTLRQTQLDELTKARGRKGRCSGLLMYRQDEDLPEGCSLPYASAHNRMTAETAESMEAAGRAPNITLFDRAAFDAWRGDGPDDAQSRARWAYDLSEG